MAKTRSAVGDLIHHHDMSKIMSLPRICSTTIGSTAGLGDNNKELQPHGLQCSLHMGAF
jgi:hypothetical protein